MSAYNIHNRVRGMVPWPGAFTYIEEDGINKVLKIWQTSLVMDSENTSGFKTKSDNLYGGAGTITKVSKDGIMVQTGDGKLLLKELQVEGGRRIPACQFVIGHRIDTGTILGEE
jgi:methionyl-tRNA formyltransferase